MEKKLVTLRGKVDMNYVGGKHYELQFDNEVFVLLGNITELDDLIDCEAEVIGTVRTDESVTYTRGKIFDVQSIKKLEYSV